MNDISELIDYIPDFISNPDELFHSLEETINWRQDEITLYGKTYPIPRFHAWYGDANAYYSYSGIPLPINPWFDELSTLKKLIEKKTDLKFNSVLANYYRDGKDSNGWHADDEKELVTPIHVASVSLGQERDFQFRKKGETRINKSLSLENGSLLVMRDPCQKYWQHQIPKRAKVERGRINLTFRLVR